MDSAPKTQTKKQRCGESVLVLEAERSDLLQALPRDILVSTNFLSFNLSPSLCFLEFEVEIVSVFDLQIKVLCCVNHGDLKHLVQVSKAIREAVSILYYINQPLIVVN
jgi:hypothetical protein